LNNSRADLAAVEVGEIVRQPAEVTLPSVSSANAAVSVVPSVTSAPSLTVAAVAPRAPAPPARSPASEVPAVPAVKVRVLNCEILIRHATVRRAPAQFGH
jgi:hypothetical protein